LKATSPAVNAGTDPGTDGTPRFQYVHPLGGEPRQALGGAWDVGAFEYGTLPSPSTDGGTPSVPVSPDEDGGLSDDGGTSGVPGSPGEDGAPDAGCGCTTSGAASSTLALLLLLALGRRRVV
jgi:uncharacterized protein (TIGR03382 family)